MSLRESEAVREHIDALHQQVSELQGSVQQARREPSQQVAARAEQVEGAMTRQAGDRGPHSAGQSQNQWQAMKADLAAKVRDLHDRLDRKKGEINADVAADDAVAAEDGAVDALDFATWTVWQAELAVLDAIDARARADERAAASGPR